MITIQISNVAVEKVNIPIHVKANITSDTAIKNIEWLSNKVVNFTVSLDQKTVNFTPSVSGTYVFTCNVWNVGKRTQRSNHNY